MISFDGEAHKENAEVHWKFLESWLHKIYVDAWVHGAKHENQNAEYELERLRLLLEEKHLETTQEIIEKS